MNSIPFITGMFQSSRIRSGMRLAALGERILAVLGFGDFELEALDDVPRDLADHARVIDDQAVFHAPIPVAFVVFAMR